MSCLLHCRCSMVLKRLSTEDRWIRGLTVFTRQPMLVACNAQASRDPAELMGPWHNSYMLSQFRPHQKLCTGLMC